MHNPSHDTDQIFDRDQSASKQLFNSPQSKKKSTYLNLSPALYSKDPFSCTTPNPYKLNNLISPNIYQKPAFQNSAFKSPCVKEVFQSQYPHNSFGICDFDLYNDKKQETIQNGNGYQHYTNGIFEDKNINNIKNLFQNNGKSNICYDGKSSSNEISEKQGLVNESHLQEMQQLQKKQLKKNRFCNCKKTKCLKLYCDCFSVGKLLINQCLTGELCGPECKCCDCSNTVQQQQYRNDAINQIKEKNIEAFRSKYTNQDSESKKLIHKKGCHCKKSNCQKKYCECFQAGILCSDSCKCEECHNIEIQDHSYGNKKICNNERLQYTIKKKQGEIQISDFGTDLFDHQRDTQIKVLYNKDQFSPSSNYQGTIKKQKNNIQSTLSYD